MARISSGPLDAGSSYAGTGVPSDEPVGLRVGEHRLAGSEGAFDGRGGEVLTQVAHPGLHLAGADAAQVTVAEVGQDVAPEEAVVDGGGARPVHLDGLPGRADVAEGNVGLGELQGELHGVLRDRGREDSRDHPVVVECIHL